MLTRFFKIIFLIYLILLDNFQRPALFSAHLTLHGFCRNSLKEVEVVEKIYNHFATGLLRIKKDKKKVSWANEKEKRKYQTRLGSEHCRRH
jgi:hypothetical protein